MNHGLYHEYEAEKHKEEYSKKLVSLICQYCRRFFESSSIRTKYCSKECKQKANKENRVVLDKICLLCGKSFETQDKKQKFCSISCGSRATNAKYKKYYICGYCGEVFSKDSAYRMKYCSRNCARNAKRVPEEIKIARVEEKQLKKHCAWCGKEFITTYPNKKYCSDDCGYSGSLRDKRSEWADAFTPRRFICKECKLEVVTTLGDTRKTFCCQTCQNKYFRRLEHQTERHKESLREYKYKREKQISEGFVEDVSYEKVYERDRGICMICGMPVPFDKEIDNSWNATIDHIIPLSKGGKHELQNCQLAHRICNSLKSNDELFDGIDWEQKACENNYWKQKFESYINLMGMVMRA